MALVQRLPRIASHPELLTFRCESCGHVHTREEHGEQRRR
jgi:hypothetical protein